MQPLQPIPRKKVPEIHVSNDLEGMVREAIEAIAADGGIYQRAEELVHIVWHHDGPADKSQKGIRRSTGAPIIRSLKLPSLRVRLAADARWMKYSKGNGEWYPTGVPDHVVQAVHAAQEWPGVPPLVGVVTTPTIRKDGSLLQEPGYDQATGLVYRPTLAVGTPSPYPTIDEEVSYDDAIRARDTLLDLVCNIPFADPVHKSAWFACLLTCLARPAIDGPCPLFAFDANVAGSGKTLLCQAIACLAYGYEAATMSQPSNDDEVRKRIVAVLADGAPMVLLDNVIGHFGGSAIEAVLTSTTYSDRNLGKLETISIRNLAVWCLTANNLQFRSSDLARRTIRCRIDSPIENPDRRVEFKYDPLKQYILDHRYQLVGSGLSIVRAYFHANCPQDRGAQMGSFPEWSRLIPQIVRWLDLPDPLLARATADTTLDPEREGLIHVMKAMRACDPYQRGMSARGYLTALYPAREPYEPVRPDGLDDARDTIEEATRTPNGKRPEVGKFAKYLQRHAKRPVENMRILRLDRDATNSGLWTVQDGPFDGSAPAAHDAPSGTHVKPS